jgi:LmbE family N-acetylglucosaminyl deacetylase
MNILIITPHPDDEIFGCAGTIDYFVNKKHNVYVIALTDGCNSADKCKIRLTEYIDACDSLGATIIIPSKIFSDQKLDKEPIAKIADVIYESIIAIKPEIVFIPYNKDLNMDHRIVSDASMIACRSQCSNVKELLMYESFESWTQNYDIPFNPNYFIPINWDTKKNAIEKYASEKQLFPHPRSSETLFALAKTHGSRCNVKFAEGFILVRKVL